MLIVVVYNYIILLLVDMLYGLLSFVALSSNTGFLSISHLTQSILS